MAVVPPGIYRRIEWRMFNYITMKQIIRDYEAGDTQLIPPSKGARGKGVHSDPTASEALRYMADPRDIQPIRDWVWCIERVHGHYEGTDHGKLIEAYYTNGGRPAEVAAALSVDIRTFYRMKEDIVTMVFLAGTQCGIIRFFDK